MLKTIVVTNLVKAIAVSLLVVTTSAGFAQLQVKGNEVTVAKKKGVLISYKYKALKAETMGSRISDRTEYEFTFLIENTTADSVKMNSKIIFETSNYSTTIQLNETLGAGEKKTVPKKITFYNWMQNKVDKPVVQSIKVEKL